MERGGVDLPRGLGGVAHYMVGAEVMGGGVRGLGSGSVAIEYFDRRFQTAGWPVVCAFGVCWVSWGTRGGVY